MVQNFEQTFTIFALICFCHLWRVINREEERERERVQEEEREQAHDGERGRGNGERRTSPTAGFHWRRCQSLNQSINQQSILRAMYHVE